MPKINRKEYEVLKSLDDKWKWIARDKSNELWVYEEKPDKDEWSEWDILGNGVREIEGGLFQFIQWEDSEPRNIQELIEEYERELTYKQIMKFYEEGFRKVGLAFRELGIVLNKESEETEVKDIEWLKKRNKKCRFT